ncbi:UDP-N-acetylgalactosamine-undecaprenyl-phosphate N-acetylgalactosaminephosphotransferase [Polaribacter huanghezhanensis]|uniref:exopolysaccharide biosynthesis polyprenyl glycosylphosphotransferase n=1 Tax=Polaribacter huanghezhanensis TaxID=1354726 RepID=UPI002647219F|nr:exopolysaccharide biosynthesis polyprenyl glycosylphosphotransferase [Polaribacter huanghezhanensis]WKD86517.1 UDP-N-acetylgalactosamine-undecaprenyl-phosphate N-acetylgalactosaminephosphotransferase [Polaribacter huanghezhanensis]
MAKKPPFLDISERKLMLRTFDVLTIVLSLTIASKYSDFTYINIKSDLIYKWFLILVIYFLLFGEVFQLYNLKVANNRFLVIRGIAVTSLITTLFYIFSPFITPSLPGNRLQVFYFFLLIAIPTIFWRFLYISLLFSPKYFKNIIVIGHASKKEKLIELIKFENFQNITCYVSNEKIEGLTNFYNAKTVDLLKIVDTNLVTEIVISTSKFSSDTVKKLNKEIILLFEKGVSIKSFETYYESATKRIPKEYLDYNFYKKINFSVNNDNRFYHFTQRVLDLILSILGLVFFAFLIPFILIGNLIGNRGSLFYTQERVGYQGKTFKIFKIRSMIKEAEKDGAVWAQKNDTRITTFGKILRNTRLDEFPQFINIIKGDMSLIGPRPERPEFVFELEDKIPFYAIRHVIKPGLTGWAQVNYPYASTIEEQETKLRYDLYYIKERSSFLDFKILIKTISIVLYFRGQ